MAPPSTIKGPLTTIYFRRFPKKVKRIFKAWCDIRGLTMMEGFIQFIEAVTKMSTCDWCSGSGMKCHIADKATDGKCSMCGGSGFKTQIGKTF